MNALPHTLRDKPDEHGGLFVVLREHADKAEIKRVENVLTLLVAADEYAREQWRFWIRSEDKTRIPKESLRASSRNAELLNNALRRYRWGVQVMAGNASLLSQLIPAPPTPASAKNQWTYWEAVTIGMLLDLVRKPGELSRFRRCSECQQWFYAIREHQKFCGAACRRHHTAQDLAFKIKRATYMRETYRPREKWEEAESKRRAGFSERSKKGGK